MTQRDLVKKGTSTEKEQEFMNKLVEDRPIPSNHPSIPAQAESELNIVLKTQPYNTPQLLTGGMATAQLQILEICAF